MAKPKGSTRAPKPERTRERQISLRVSEAEFEAFHRMAKELDLPLTTWARLVLRRAADMPTP